MTPPPYPAFAQMPGGAPGEDCEDCYEPLDEVAYWSDLTIVGGDHAVLYLCGACVHRETHTDTITQAANTELRCGRR